jgi:hypothetical protein
VHRLLTIGLSVFLLTGLTAARASAATFVFEGFTLDNLTSEGDGIFAGSPLAVPHLTFDDTFTGGLSFEYKAADGFGLWASEVPINSFFGPLPEGTIFLGAFPPKFGLECPFPSQPNVCNPVALIYWPASLWLTDIDILNFGIDPFSGLPPFLIRDITVSPIPEPGTLLLIVGGGLPLVRALRRERARRLSLPNRDIG